MSKHVHSWPTPKMALSLALLFSLILFAACGTGTDRDPPIPTAANTPGPDTGVAATATPEMGTPGAIEPDAAARFDCANVNQIPSVECDALVALYNSTQGPGWADNSGWLATDTPCTWSGIECAGGHISNISLGYNQLTGILPPELENLSHLRMLGLSVNRLHGPIPAELGNLSELVALEMSGNQFAGHLPKELGDLPKLRSLFLNINQLSGSIPPALGNIKSLQSLGLSHNQFSGAIPEELGNLAQLSSLYLSHNQLSGAIPAALGRLNKLSDLDLSYNQLSGPVPEFTAQISGLSLWGNRLEGTIPASGQAPVVVDYKGIHFSADPSLANSIWPEMKLATPLPEIPEGPPYWLAIPEHIRITFAVPGLSPYRRRMGFNLAAEAQILVFRLADLVEINPFVQAQIESLRDLLARRGTLPAGELPLLPLTNSAQVFHAQAQFLASDDIQGLRFISQHSQDPHPIMLSQELFYTFQGFTNDGVHYVAAFFPLTTDALPDAITKEDWQVINDSEASYASYLVDETAILNQLPSDGFTPDLTLLDAVITSLSVEPDNALRREPTNAPDSY